MRLRVRCVIDEFLEFHPFYADLLEPEFVALSPISSPEDFSRFGTALGAFHLEFKGKEIPDLELRGAAWFSRASCLVIWFLRQAWIEHRLNSW